MKTPVTSGSSHAGICKNGRHIGYQRAETFGRLPDDGQVPQAAKSACAQRREGLPWGKRFEGLTEQGAWMSGGKSAAAHRSALQERRFHELLRTSART